MVVSWASQRRDKTQGKVFLLSADGTEVAIIESQESLRYQAFPVICSVSLSTVRLPRFSQHNLRDRLFLANLWLLEITTDQCRVKCDY